MKKDVNNYIHANGLENFIHNFKHDWNKRIAVCCIFIPIIIVLLIIGVFSFPLNKYHTTPGTVVGDSVRYVRNTIKYVPLQDLGIREEDVSEGQEISIFLDSSDNVIGGKIYTGFNFCGAELGHVVIEYNGRQCNCGRKGCFEAYSSATALITATKKAMEEDKDSAMWNIAGSIDKVDGKTAFDAMRAGDKSGKAVVDEYLNYLGCGLTNVVNTFQPEMLLIGGGICKEGDYLTKPLEEYIKRESYCINPERSTVLGICKLGNDAGIVGAANLYRLKD